MKPRELNRLTASEAALKLQQREITAEQLVRSCLDRIEERESVVHAWSQVAADSALAQARKLDGGPVQGLLHGLPIGVKDLFDTDGITTTYGSPIYANHVPNADAAAVALAREAGAIVLGKTVTTEFATFHPGKTHNPHRPGHTPGGSSSGSAAAVADFMVPLAFGTQTAASIIRPAAFCGVVGYKPTYGSIVRAGVKSLSETLDTIGAFGRSVADVALFVAALTGDKRLAEASTVSVDSLRIGMCRTHEWPLADADTQAAFDVARKRFTAAGAVVTEIELPAHLATMVQVQSEIMAFEAARSLAHERVRHPALLSSDLTALLDTGLAISVEQHQRNLASAGLGRRLVDDLFASCDLLLAPSAVGTAPEGIRATGNPVFSRMWTLLGVPCVHLPFMTGVHGLPVGMQAVGRAGDDRRLILAAGACLNAF